MYNVFPVDQQGCESQINLLGLNFPRPEGLEILATKQAVIRLSTRLI